VINERLLKELTGNEIKVLLYFDRKIMADEVALPVRKIAEDLNLNVGTVVNSIEALIEHKIILKRVVIEGMVTRAYYSWNDKGI
jgi:DNA-binding MarR family transcriptional regulator